jgi:hypothetical protein
MKKYLYLILVVNSLIACGGPGNDLESIAVVENKKPSIPVLVAPVNNLLCTDNTVFFSWNTSLDLDGDAINYTIQIAKDNQFSQIVHNTNILETTTTFSLDKGKAYYWRVKATDSKNESSSFSSTFQFYTEGVASENHQPFSPDLVSPELSSVVQTTTTTLEWTASHVDNDNLVYDIFFGTENPPLQKLSANQTENILNVKVASSKVYYWKVVVKDSKGAQSIGQVWNFKTD